MLGKIEDKTGRGQQRMRCLDIITDSNGHEFEQTLGDCEGQGMLLCCSPWDRRVRHNLVTEQHCHSNIQNTHKGWIQTVIDRVPFIWYN